jgi:hypothetical protein
MELSQVQGFAMHYGRSSFASRKCWILNRVRSFLKRSTSRLASGRPTPLAIISGARRCISSYRWRSCSGRGDGLDVQDEGHYPRPDGVPVQRRWIL